MQATVEINVTELKHLVAEGECERVSFKRATGPGQRIEAAQTACAMLNGSGGFVVFGVNRGRIIGQPVNERTLEDVKAVIRGIEPPVHVPIEQVTLENARKVLVLQIPPGNGHRPYTFEGQAYVREKNQTLPLATSLNEIQQKLIALLFQDGPCSRAVLHKKLRAGIKPQTLQRHLSKLKQLDLVNTLRKGRTTNWKLAS